MTKIRFETISQHNADTVLLARHQNGAWTADERDLAANFPTGGKRYVHFARDTSSSFRHAVGEDQLDGTFLLGLSASYIGIAESPDGKCLGTTDNFHGTLPELFLPQAIKAHNRAPTADEIKRAKRDEIETHNR